MTRHTKWKGEEQISVTQLSVLFTIQQLYSRTACRVPVSEPTSQYASGRCCESSTAPILWAVSLFPAASAQSVPKIHAPPPDSYQISSQCCPPKPQTNLTFSFPRPLPSANSPLTINSALPCSQRTFARRLSGHLMGNFCFRP